MINTTASASGLRKFYYFLSANIHPYSLIITIVLDLVWNIPELAIGSCLEIPLMAIIFTICYLVVNSIQLNLAGDEKTAAQTKALVFGIIAAVPFSVIGLGVGAVAGTLKLIFGFDRYAMLTGKLILEWADFEKDINRLLPSTYDFKNDTSKQIAKKLKYLIDKNQIAQSLLDSRINPIREIRNRIAHPFENGLPTEQEIETAFYNLQSVRNKLQN